MSCAGTGRAGGVNKIGHPDLAGQGLAVERLAVLRGQLEFRNFAKEIEQRTRALRACSEAPTQYSECENSRTSCRTVEQHQAVQQRQINHRGQQDTPRLLPRAIRADAHAVIEEQQALAPARRTNTRLPAIAKKFRHQADGNQREGIQQNPARGGFAVRFHHRQHANAGALVVFAYIQAMA